MSNPSPVGQTTEIGRLGLAAGGNTPFRFYDNRQKYLAFVNTCNEKQKVADRAAEELREIRPTPPALRLFDAGMGDATVLARLMRSAHASWPAVPLLVVAKEISREDVRLGLEKMADRFLEHPTTVLVVTNLQYADAPALRPRHPEDASRLNWQVARLKGHSSYEYAQQIEALHPLLDYGWATRPSEASGNPVYVRPSVLVIYREDHAFLLDGVIPRPETPAIEYDFVLASQPWRARMSAAFKVGKVLLPLVRRLAAGGRLLVIQSHGDDPALEIVRSLWPGEAPFQVDRHKLLAELARELGDEAARYALPDPPDSESIFRYEMHSLPAEIGDRIGTSMLFAAWNAAIYVNQIEDERLGEVAASGRYLEATQAVLRKHGGLWFNDESFVVSRRS
jgi:CheY-like chemotaxis protein